MKDSAIYLDNVSHSFGHVKALNNLSFEVPRGIIFGFLGPNGAGKTTTIRLCLSLLEPSNGDIEVLGYNTRLYGEQIRAHTGALLEHSGLYEQLSAEDNLEFFGRAYQLPRDQLRDRIRELLEQNELWERRREPVRLWSRGMKQKLAIARAMLHRPSLILLDEPTAGLDVAAAVEVRQHLVSLASQQGVTVFLTTHNMNEAEKLCSLLAVIRAGNLVALGHPDELRARTGKPRLEIRARGVMEDALTQLRNLPEVAAVTGTNGRLTVDLGQEIDSALLINLLVDAGVQVEEVHRPRASLEEVYMTLLKEESA